MHALPFNHDSLARWRVRLPAMLEAGIIVLLALQAARLLWLVITPTGPVGAEESNPAVPETTASLSRSDVFFRQMTTDAGADGAAEALGYRLFGVRGAGSRTGSAILADAEGKQSAYRVGETIAAGVTLDAVGIDHVVLRSGGGTRRIDLPGGALPSPASAPATPASGTPGVLPTGAPARNATSSAAIDPQQLLAQAGLSPRSDGGYTVIPRGDGAVLRQAGLQAGDVLLSVNGQTLTPERLGELNEELKGQPEVAITFERNGETRTVTLPASPP